MDDMIIGSAIKGIREEKGMTQADLADAIGVSHKTISKWETGKSCPDIGLLEPISAAFGISLIELVSRMFSVEASSDLEGNTFVCPVCGSVVKVLED